MEKINLVELLKDCPKGMELDCHIWDNVKFDHIDMTRDYPIYITIGQPDSEQHTEHLTKYGQWDDNPNAKCIIFPKGKTTWEGFVPPCKFKNEDIIYVKDKYNQEWCSILNKCENDKLYTYIDFCINNNTFYPNKPNILCEHKDIIEYRLATEEEKEKLFNAIKDKCYRWDDKTKILEKLTKSYKEETKNNAIFDYNTQCCDITNNLIKEENETLEVIEPRFRVGNRIRLKSKHNCIYTVFCLAWGDNNILAYKLLPDNDKHLILVSLNKQDNYELVPNKFDINTLIPFESKVLVRDNDAERWRPTFWGFYDNDDSLNYPYECVGSAFAQCIPYEGNEHLQGTNNKCDNYYKTWNDYV